MKIAVIGAGMFGLAIASEFAARNIEVSIFEKESEILSGSTSGSIMRVHQGLHYPRDDETARQSSQSYGEFVEKFSDCIDFNYLNFYSLSKKNSRTSPLEFEKFIQRNSLNATRLDDSSLDVLGVDSSKLECTWLCREGVLSLSRLKSRFLEEIRRFGIATHFECEIASARRVNSEWQLLSDDSAYGGFDLVIQTTYGIDNITINTKESEELCIFQRTLVLEASILLPERIGITVMDGNFLTFLPKAFSENYFVYSPVPSVLESRTQAYFPQEWKEEIDELKIEFGKREIIEKFQEFFITIDEFRVVNHVKTFRNLQASSQRTDSRTSRWREISKNYVKVVSGKLDHSLSVANEIIDHFV